MGINTVDKESLTRISSVADFIEAKQPERDEIEKLTREFLARGGEIKKVSGFAPLEKVDWRDKPSTIRSRSKKP